MKNDYKDKYILTDHAIERFNQRTNYSKQNTIKRMLRDLHAMRGKKIVTIGNTRYVFYKQPNNNTREFVIEIKGSKYIVTTVINRNSEDSEAAYQNRLRKKKQYEDKLKEETK